jgi:hypothetical protein
MPREDGPLAEELEIQAAEQFKALQEGCRVAGPVVYAALQIAVAYAHAGAEKGIEHARLQVQAAQELLASGLRNNTTKRDYLDVLLRGFAEEHFEATDEKHMDLANGTRVQLVAHKGEWRIEDKGDVIAWLKENDSDAHAALVEDVPTLNGPGAKAYINALKSGEVVPGTTEIKARNTSTITHHEI